MIEASKSDQNVRVLRYGMVGGGPGSFIGSVHRKSINLDGRSMLVAGCFSSDSEKTRQTGLELGLDSSRAYVNYAEMAAREAIRTDRIDFAVITAPNYVHYSACIAFLEKGISVVCEKPLTVSLNQALELKKLAQKNNCLFCVAYAYTGYVMVKEAREIVRRGEIGDIRVVMAEYPQDWLADSIEKDGQKQALWRTDPEKSGISNCVGDIGSHIENMVSYITGLRIVKLCANMDIFGEGRLLDTNAEIMLKYDNGASGVYWCSQIAIGCDNGLKVRIFGTEGSIEFEQEKPNHLIVAKKGEAPRIYSRGNGYIHPEAAAYSRIPAGHPEGYFEAFANMYSAFSDALHRKLTGEKVVEADFDYPGADMGIDGVRFIWKCVESAKNGSVWVNFKKSI